jgi:sec-independent protein translocase protein TatB
VLGNLDPAKILVILVIVLVVVGPERLPKVARTLGAAWHEFQRVRQDVADEVRAALPDTGDLPRIPRIPSVRGTLTGFITDTSPPKSGTRDGQARNGQARNGSAAPPVGASTGRANAGVFVPPADDPSMN